MSNECASCSSTSASSINYRGTVKVAVKKVIYNDPATIVYWSDNTRTVVKCQPGDTFDPKLGFLLAVLKRSCGNKGNYNELLKEHVPGYGKESTVTEMRKELASFCRQNTCMACLLESFKCGSGFHFEIPHGYKGYMTDVEIRECYNVMKGAKKNE